MEERNGMSAFGVWLKTALEESGMKQRDLARITKIQESLISKYINGKAMPSGTTMQRILDVFGCHIVIVPNEE